MKTIIIFFSIFFSVLLNSGFVFKVSSTEVAVKVNKLGFNQGIEEKVYGPGTYFYAPFLTEWYVFDTRVKNINMSIDKKGYMGLRNDLKFKTIDGNDISLDITITYRIIPSKVNHIVDQIAISNKNLENYIIRTIVRSRPRDIFGLLTTEEFYVSSKRTEQAQLVREELNRILNPYGVIVEQVWTRSYRFNESYMQAIQEKLVAEQQKLQNIAATKATHEEYARKNEEAVGDVNRMKAKVDGEFIQGQIQSDAYYMRQKNRALAEEAEGIAESEAIREMNKAFNLKGASLMAQLKIAESLKNKKILLLPKGEGHIDFNSTDVNQLIATSLRPKGD